MPSTPLSSFLAGIAGGSASTILLYPLDLVKVRMQVDERRRNSVLHKSNVDAPSNSFTKNNIATTNNNKPRTICTTVRGVIQHEGYLGLYRGLTPAIIGSAASWGGFFILYEEMKRQLLVRKQRQYANAAFVVANTTNMKSSSNSTAIETQQQQTAQEVTVKLGPIEHFSASCLSGACMVALTNPLWLIKTRLQLQNSNLIEQQISSQQQSTSATQTAKSASKTSVVSKQTANSIKPKQQLKPPYKGLIHAAYTIIKEEGILALYKGSIPALMLVSHGGIQFVTYEFLKGHFTNFFDTSTKSSVGNDKDKNDGWEKSSGRKKGTIRERMRDSLGYLVMGAVSKFVASTTTYPLQVIKARLQQRSQVIEISETTGEVIVSKREYSGVLDCIRRIIKNEGMNGFFKGCLTNALRVAPSAAITFVTYEFVLDMLSE